jgi:hypothetical protein
MEPCTSDALCRRAELLRLRVLLDCLRITKTSISSNLALLLSLGLVLLATIILFKLLLKKVSGPRRIEGKQDHLSVWHSATFKMSRLLYCA